MWWNTLREVEGLVSVERWSCNRGASCVVEYTVGKLVSTESRSAFEVFCVWWGMLRWSHVSG